MFELDTIIPLDKAMALYIAYTVDILGTQRAAAQRLGISVKTTRRYLKDHIKHHKSLRGNHAYKPKQSNGMLNIQPDILLTNADRLRMRDDMLNRDRL